jgi:hypothetical protein
VANGYLPCGDIATAVPSRNDITLLSSSSPSHYYKQFFHLIIFLSIVHFGTLKIFFLWVYLYSHGRPNGTTVGDPNLGAAPPPRTLKSWDRSSSVVGMVVRMLRVLLPPIVLLLLPLLLPLLLLGLLLGLELLLLPLLSSLEIVMRSQILPLPVNNMLDLSWLIGANDLGFHNSIFLFVFAAAIAILVVFLHVHGLHFLVSTSTLGIGRLGIGLFHVMLKRLLLMALANGRELFLVTFIVFVFVVVAIEIVEAEAIFFLIATTTSTTTKGGGGGGGGGRAIAAVGSLVLVLLLRRRRRRLMLLVVLLLLLLLLLLLMLLIGS